MKQKPYLDVYAMRLRAGFEAEIGTHAFDFATLLKDICRESEGLLARPDEHSPASQVELGFFAYMRPFVEPEAFQPSPVAVTVTSESVEIFRAGYVNGSVRDLAEEDIRAARAAYVDLPHGSFPVGENMQVRAILAAPEAGGRLRITAAIGQRGSNKAEHFSWLAGDAEVSTGASVSATSIDNEYFVTYKIDIIEADALNGLQLSLRPRAIRKLIREIEQVIFLAVAQHRSLIDRQEDGELEVLPHIGLTDPRRRTGNRKKTERENSFFRIKRLPYLRGVTVMAEAYQTSSIAADAVGDCTPGKLINVRPFYRMQAYGPRHSLRRLIWVPAHSRRVRDDGRVDMIVLPAPEHD